MKITDAQNIQMKYFLSRSLFLGGGVSLIFSKSDKDSWIAIILGYLLGIGIIYIYSKISDSINNSLHDYLQKRNIINVMIKVMLVLFYLFFIFLEIIIITTFLFSYYLPFTNILISSLPFLFLAVFLANKGMKAISNVSQVLFVIAVTLFILKGLALIPYIKIDNYLPIFTINKTSLFTSAGIYAVLSTAPYLLMIGDKSTFKVNFKSYTLGFLSLLVVFVITVGGFGINLVKTFAYPEYVILRQINVFNFIQNIENLIAASWFFDIFIAIAIGANKVKEICFKKNIYVYITIIILLLLAYKFVIGNYIGNVRLYNSFTFTILIISIIIYLLFSIKKGFKFKSNEKCK